MDELLVWGFVGLPPEEAKDDEHIYIYTHKSLEINYNADRVKSKFTLGPMSSLLAAAVSLDSGMQKVKLCNAVSSCVEPHRDCSC